RETLTALLLANLKASRPNIDSSKGSPEWARINALVELTYGVHWNVREVQKSIWPDANTPTAELEAHANLRLSADPRRSAVAAAGTNALNVTGTLAGAAVEAGDVLVHVDGTQFQITEDVTIGSATVAVSVAALTKGIVGNKLTGDVMDFESAPANIETEATLVSDLDGGLDQETNAELLERVQYAYRNPPAGGRCADYWAWAMAIAGVGSAYCYGPSSYALDGRRGLGIVDVAILAQGQTGADRRPTAALVQTVQDALDLLRPVHAKAGLALRPSATAQDIDVTLTPREGYEPDWADAAPGTYQVSSVAAQVITWNVAPPADLQALIDAGGTARIFVKGQVLTVTAYTTTPDTTTVTETMSPALSAADNIHAAGPCSAPALAAIKTYMDSLGPARDAGGGSGEEYADPNQNWDDSCRPSQIFAALVERRIAATGGYTGVLGVREAAVTTPGATVTPVDVPASVPPFLYWDDITVRYI
ncbi:MAG TPA: hypothetical protein ENL34_07600, partial [Chloroflexi bacterium]|nr:hypothetical protein [Chloroflexota bacterium]